MQNTPSFVRRLGVALLAVAGASAPAAADKAFIQASQAACERMRSCALQAIDEVPLEYRDMVEQSLDSLCAYLPDVQDYSGFSAAHPRYKPAMACLNSISSLSCEDMDENGDDATPECERLDRLDDAHFP